MLSVTLLLYDWCRFLRCIYYILYFRDGGISPGIIILLSDDRVFSYYYLPKVRLLLIHKFLEPIILSYGLSLNFLRRSVDISGIHFISSYNRMSILLLVFYLTLIYLLAYYFSIICLQAFRPEYKCLLTYVYLLTDLYSVWSLLCNSHFSCLF